MASMATSIATWHLAGVPQIATRRVAPRAGAADRARMHHREPRPSAALRNPARRRRRRRRRCARVMALLWLLLLFGIAATANTALAAPGDCRTFAVAIRNNGGHDDPARC